jgi:mannose-6-phosphate isomerase-like protein (cupin superfamily)
LSKISPNHIEADLVPWTGNPTYPPELRAVYRYKELIGPGAPDPSPVAASDVRMGLVELAEGAVYPLHAHPAPEIYYVIAGTARWTIDDETFLAPPGTAIRHLPNARHAMANIGPGTLRLIYFWWTPNGDHESLFVGARLIDEKLE